MERLRFYLVIGLKAGYHIVFAISIRAALPYAIFVGSQRFAMPQQFAPIREWHDVDRRIFFDEIVPGEQPAVLRGLVADWPIVRHAQQSNEALYHYLASLDIGRDVKSMLIPPGDDRDAPFNRQIAYTPDMRDFNFVSATVPLTRVIDQLRRYACFPNPPSVTAQSTLIAECLPGLLNELRMPILEPAIQPRLWFGNMMSVPAHFDQSNNVACVAAGKRRFTLLPPEQISNMYVGPIDFTPAGLPMSMVNFTEPDFDRFPRAREAIAAAQSAELMPGDAIYIPPLWWHQVDALQQCNMLINYWWYQHAAPTDPERSGLDALALCLVTMKKLPAAQKAAWGAIFKHYLFDDQVDPTELIVEDRQGILGPLTLEREHDIRQFIANKIR